MLDFTEAADYASRSQIARVAIETWVAANVACWRCTSPLLLLPANTKLLDAVCREKHHQVQIKSFAKAAPQRITAAAFGPIAVRLRNAALPDYILVSYDTPRSVVLMAEYLDGTEINANRVHARRPLAKTARRAGWIGATIDLSGLARHVIVGPSFLPEIMEWS